MLSGTGLFVEDVDWLLANGLVRGDKPSHGGTIRGRGVAAVGKVVPFRLAGCNKRKQHTEKHGCRCRLSQGGGATGVEIRNSHNDSITTQRQRQVPEQRDMHLVLEHVKEAVRDAVPPRRRRHAWVVARVPAHAVLGV